MDELLLIEDGELPELALSDEEFDGAFGSSFDLVDVSHLPAASIHNPAH